MVRTGIGVDASDDGLPASVRAEILAAYEARLGATQNPIHDDPRALRQALRQAEAVIEDVARFRHSGNDRESAALGSTLLSNSLDVGIERAEHGVHPLHSLRAATVLFEAALPPLLVLYSGPEVVSPCEPDHVAICLHRAIMVRVNVGSLS